MENQEFTKRKLVKSFLEIPLKEKKKWEKRKFEGKNVYFSCGGCVHGDVTTSWIVMWEKVLIELFYFWQQWDDSW